MNKLKFLRKTASAILAAGIIITMPLSAILETTVYAASQSSNITAAGSTYTNAPTTNASSTTGTSSNVEWPAAPEVTSESAILIDADTGAVLYEKDSHRKCYPASTTKILTGLLAIENCSMTDTITFSSTAANSVKVGEDANIGTKAGEEYTIEQALYALLLYSANEVAYGLAEQVSGSLSAFTDLMNAKAKELGMPGITNSVEDVIIARDIVLSKDTGAQLHLCHCSTKDSVEMVRIAKEEGLHVSAEVCPHHFTLTSDDITEYVPQIEAGILIPKETDADTNYKMNPPLRTKEDVEALKEGLRDNIMDVISTDHAPHTFDDKNTSMKKAPFGIVGLETAACLTYSELVLGGYLTPMQMAEKMSYNPAKIVGIDKGDIQPGKKADIVIFDPKETYTIDKNKFASKGRNTPFHGRKVTGRVKCTICDGNVVFNEIKNKTK